MNRTVKQRVRNLFDFKVMRLIEALVQDPKYGIGMIGVHGSMVGRVYD